MVRGYPSLSSISTSIGVLQCLNYTIAHYSGALLMGYSSVGHFSIPIRLVHGAEDSVIFLNTVLTQAKETEVSFPNKYRVNSEPVSLRLGSLQRVKTSVHRGRNCLRYYIPGKLYKAGVALSFPDINTARSVVVTTYLTGNAAAVVGTTHRPRVYSLTSCLGSYNTSVSKTNRNIIIVRNMDSLYNSIRAVVPSEVITTALVDYTTMANSGVVLGKVVSSRLTTLVPVFGGTKYGVEVSSKGLRVGTPRELGSVGAVEAVPFPNFPASTRTPLLTATYITSKAAIFIRGVFRGECERIPRLIEVNTTIGARNGMTITRNIRVLCNTSIRTPSLHKNTTLIITNLYTRNGARVNNIRCVRENCRYVRSALASVKTSVGGV